MYCNIKDNLFYDENKKQISKKKYIEIGLFQIEDYLEKKGYVIVEFNKDMDKKFLKKYYEQAKIICPESIMKDTIIRTLREIITNNKDLEENVRVYGLIDIRFQKLLSISVIRLKEYSIDSIYFDSSCTLDKSKMRDYVPRINKANYFIRAYILLYYNLKANIKEIHGDIFIGNAEFLIKYHTYNKCEIIEEKGNYKYYCEMCAFLNQFFLAFDWKPQRVPTKGRRAVEEDPLFRGSSINFAVNMIKYSFTYMNSKIKNKNINIEEESHYTKIFSPSSYLSFEYYFDVDIFKKKCEIIHQNKNSFCIPSKQLIGYIS
jgi:hypothetical protein